VVLGLSSSLNQAACTLVISNKITVNNGIIFFGIFDFVKSGRYDLGHSGSYYWKGKDINTLFFTSMPFGMTATEQHAWFEYGGGQELMDKVYARASIVPLSSAV
jgi:TRAP-type mannitol/chloroaromatic compound transport system substrate-binding protein